jgi:hypothetical protein
MEVSANGPHDVGTSRVDCFELFLALRDFRFSRLHLDALATMGDKDECRPMATCRSTSFG